MKREKIIVPFFFSEQLECRALDASEVRQIEMMSGNSGESLVILNSEQYFLGIDFVREGVQNCYVLVFQNQDVFDQVLEACQEAIEAHESIEREPRIWTAKTGHKINATFLKMANGLVLLVAPNGQLVKIAANALSQNDQIWLRD